VISRHTWRQRDGEWWLSWTYDILRDVDHVTTLPRLTQLMGEIDRLIARRSIPPLDTTLVWGNPDQDDFLLSLIVWERRRELGERIQPSPWHTGECEEVR